MRTRPARPFTWTRAAFCLTVAAALGPRLDAKVRPDPDPPPPATILFIGNLNFDCDPDTVVAAAGDGIPAHRLPTAIHWGGPRRTAVDTAAGGLDTALNDPPCPGISPRARRVAVTMLSYPAWAHLSGAVAFNKMNADSLDDMTLFIRGTVGDSLHRADTLRALLVFAQQGLDTLPVLDLAPIDGFQVAPFFAMELRKGSELVEPDVRDMSGVTSYVIQPVALDLGEHHQDTVGHVSPSDSIPAQPIRLRVYPNPTGGAAQVEVDSIPPGDYGVDVVAVNGHVYLHQEVSVTIAGTLFQTLDLHALPVGFYVVRISDGGALFGIYPIIITR